jgi:predicted Zn-dependent protease
VKRNGNETISDTTIFKNIFIYLMQAFINLFKKLKVVIVVYVSLIKLKSLLFYMSLSLSCFSTSVQKVGEYCTSVVTWPIGYLVNSKFSLNFDEVGFALSLKLPKAL